VHEENAMTTVIRRFLSDDTGATSIEYAVIASLLSIAIVTVVAGLGSKLQTTYQSVQKAFQ
jgi:pilus assembly protein Flp/PilA